MKPSNITSTFKKCRQEHRPALLTYTVSGDPNKKKSFEILKTISSHADICEIGIGHNCNTGDGKQIQNLALKSTKYLINSAEIIISYLLFLMFLNQTLPAFCLLPEIHLQH